MHIWQGKLVQTLSRDLTVEGDRYQLSCLAQFTEKVHYETEHEDLGFPYGDLILDHLELLLIVNGRGILQCEVLILLLDLLL